MPSIKRLKKPETQEVRFLITAGSEENFETDLDLSNVTKSQAQEAEPLKSECPLINNCVFYQKKKSTFILLVSTRGELISFCITQLLDEFFPTIPKKAKSTLNLFNLTKETYEHELGRNNYYRYCEKGGSTNPELVSFKFISHLHKDFINFMEVQYEDKLSPYVYTMCNDGYFKISSIKRMVTNKCSLNLNYPLPIKWANCFNNYMMHKADIEEALLILNTIIKTLSSEFSGKELKNFDITKFLDTLNSMHCSKPTMNPNHIQLLHTELSPKDINGKHPSQEFSLQSLEAYKRVQIIQS